MDSAHANDKKHAIDWRASCCLSTPLCTPLSLTPSLTLVFSLYFFACSVSCHWIRNAGHALFLRRDNWEAMLDEVVADCDPLPEHTLQTSKRP